MTTALRDDPERSSADQLNRLLAGDVDLVDWHRHGADEAPVVAVVVAAGADPVAVAERLCEALGPCPPRIQVLSRLPRDAVGEVDDAALAALPINDGQTIAELEGAATQPLAVVAVPREARLPRRHLDEVLPMTAAGPVATAPVTELRTTADVTAEPAVVCGGPMPSGAILADDLLAALDGAVERGQGELCFCGADGRITARCSYAALRQRARAMAAALVADGLEPDRAVLLQCPRIEEQVVGLWACLYAGLRVVPMQAPPVYHGDQAELQRLVAAKTVLADAAIMCSAAQVGGLDAGDPVLATATRLVFEDLDGRNEQVALPQRGADDCAVMMLTSGSTGLPKVVPLSHRMICHRSAAAAALNGLGPDGVTLNWMPFSHVASSVCFHLRDVQLGNRQIHVPSDHILGDPLNWLDLLEREGVCFTFAPNFAFALLNERLDEEPERRWDLSRLTWLMNGGEAIVPRVARGCLQRLIPHGLRPEAMLPAWGMSEVSSGVTYGHRFRLETTADGDAVVSVGQPIAGFDMRIVDEQDQAVAMGDEGRLQVRGATLFAGYLGRERADDFTDDGWFRTGDLGRLRDGELIITGREKDVVIINGANYAASAIEGAAETVPGLVTSCTAACGVCSPRDGSERLALFVVPEEPEAAWPALVDRLRQAVQRAQGLGIDYVIPCRVDEIPKTEIGKIQRPKLKADFQAGRFDERLRRLAVLLGGADTIADCNSVMRWQPCAARAVLPLAPTLISDDDAGCGRAVSALLGEAGVPVALVAAPGDAAAWQAAADALGQPAVTYCCTWGQSTCSDEAAHLDRVLAWARAATGSQVDRPLALLADRQSARLGADDHLDPIRHAAAGIAACLGQAHPGLRVRQVDGADAAQLLHECADPGADLEYAWRDGRRYARRVQAISHRADPAPAPLRRGGRYLLVGGGGGIGRALATWLRRSWAAEVISLGRNSGDLQADICDPAALATAMQAAGSLDAVIHLAGAFAPGELQELSGDRLLADQAAKIAGTAVLRDCCAASGLPLIAFSSVIALLGDHGAAGYAVGCRYQEALLADQPTARVLRWSAWRDTGMSAGRAEAEAAQAAAGVLTLDPTDACRLLHLALAQPDALVQIGLHADHPQMLARGCGEAREARALHAFSMAGPTPAAVDRCHRLSSLPVAADGRIDRAQLADRARFGHRGALVPPANEIERVVLAAFREQLGTEAVGCDEDFFALGGQSLRGARLLAELAERYQVDLAMTDLFAHASVQGLAALIASREGQSVSIPQTGAEPERPTYAMERMWFVQRLHPDNPMFAISAIIRWPQMQPAARIAAAIAACWARHQGLRCTMPDGETVALLPADAPPAASPVVPGQSARQVADALVLQPFDLATGPLLRWTVVEERGGSALVLVMHHAIADGWSLGRLHREIASVVGGRPLADGGPSLGDVAAWQRHAVEAGLWDDDLRYWREQLAGPGLAGTTVPSDRPHPPVLGYDGACHQHLLPGETKRGVQRLAASCGASSFSLLLAVYAALIHRLSGSADVRIGTAVANRDRAAVQDLVACLINMVVVRVDCTGARSFAEHARRVHATVGEAAAHGELPFERVVQALLPERDTAHTPLFQLAYDYRDPQLTASQPGLPQLEPMPAALPTAQYDLHLTVEERDEGLALLWEYRSELFDAATIARYAATFQQLLEQVLTAPDRQLDACAMLAPSDAALLTTWETGPASTAPRCLHQLVDEQVVRAGAAAALIDAGGSMSYAELQRASRAYAATLQAAGIVAGDRVALFMPRGRAAIIAQLACVRLGAAWLSIDPSYPDERIRDMLHDSGARLVLDSAATPLPPALGAAVRGDDPARWNGEPASLAEADDPEAVAYMIYTSGSTGRPKGVLVPHRGLATVAAEQARLFGAGPDSRVLQFASPSFDASVFDLLMALANGGALVLVDNGQLLPGPALERTLREQRVSIATLPPSALQAMEASNPSGLGELACICVAGEACPAAVPARWAPGRRFFNLYGPTETTIWATAQACLGDDAAPAIGGPIAGSICRVCDAAGHRLPPGVPGELWIAGVGLSHGYHERPSLTAERFPERDGRRWYRSGDLVRWNAAGTLDFLGRIDRQVKVRGYRIELGEVERCILEQDGVAEVCVFAHGEGDGRILAAAVVPVDGAAFDRDGLRARLAGRLPAFMCPSRLLVCERLPLTSNGKVDHAALGRELQVTHDGGRAADSAAERSVAAAWGAVLDIDPVPVDVPFFELGGNSLTLAQVHTAICAAIGREFPFVDCFRFPTVASLAEHLDRSAAATAAPAPARDLSAGKDRLRKLAARRKR